MALPPVIIELKALSGDLRAKIGEAKAELGSLESSGNTHMQGLAKAGKVAALSLAAIGVAAIAVAGESVKMASAFQESTTQLITGAGESEKNIDAVRKGILAMAGAVGTMPEELSKGMYLIESAGYHGAQGLSVLKAAAQGAKVGGADMTVVANGLTTAMTDYHIPASRANAVTSALVATVAAGKMKMGDLAGSLGMVMPKAAALGVSFQDVTGAMATMTGAGMSARRASMNLANTIMSLGAPGKAASNSLKEIGLSAQQVKDDLSKKGLAGTLEEIENHVGQKFPKGSVASVTALKNILGGTTGYGTALALTGTHMKAFEANTKSVGSALTGQNKNVQGFALTQKDLAFQVAAAKASAEALGIKIGTLLIPVIQKIIPMIANLVTWLMEHKTVALVLAGVIGGVLVAATVAWAVSLFTAGGALAFLISPITLVVVGIGLLVAGIIYAYNHFQTFHDVVNAVWEWLKGAVVATVGFVRDHWQLLLGIVLGPIAAIAIGVATHWDAVKSATVGIWNAIVGFFAGIPAKVSAAISTVIDFVKKVFSYTPLGLVITNFGAIVSFVGGIPGKILGALGNLGQLLVNAGGDLLRGLANGITGAISGVIDAAKNAASAAVNAVKGALGIHSPSTVFAELGKNTVQGMIVGIEGHKGVLAASMTSLVKVPRVGPLGGIASAGGASGASVSPLGGTVAQSSPGSGGTGSGATSADIAALGELLVGLRADLRALPRTYQTMTRQTAGAR